MLLDAPLVDVETATKPRTKRPRLPRSGSDSCSNTGGPTPSAAATLLRLPPQLSRTCRLSCITPPVMCCWHGSPGRVLVNPIVTGIIKEMDAADATDKVEDRLKSIQEELGLDPKQVEFVVVSISPETVSAIAPPPGPDQFGPRERSSRLSPIPRLKKPACSENDEFEADGKRRHSTIRTSYDGVLSPGGPGDGGPPANFGSFEPPPSPAVLVRLNAPFDGEAFHQSDHGSARRRTQRRSSPFPPKRNRFGGNAGNREETQRRIPSKMAKKKPSLRALNTLVWSCIRRASPRTESAS